MLGKERQAFVLGATIAPDVLIYFFMNSDPNLTQTPIPILKLAPNVTQALILNLENLITLFYSAHLTNAFYTRGRGAEMLSNS